MPFFVLVSSQSRLGLVSSHLGLGDNFLFGLVSVSSRWGKISLVSSRSRLGQKICRYYFSVSVSCYNPQDKISRSRSRTKIQPLLLLGLGLVQEIWSRPTLAICQLPIYYDNNCIKTEIVHVTLACEDEASEAHKVVQLNRSPFFSLQNNIWSFNDKVMIVGEVSNTSF